MFFTCLNHQLHKNQTLGFFPSRLVYEAEVPEVARDVKREVRDVASEQQAYETAKNTLKAKRDVVLQTGGEVDQAFKDYQESALGALDLFEGWVVDKDFPAFKRGGWNLWGEYQFPGLWEIDKFSKDLLLKLPEARANLEKLKKEAERVKSEIPNKITEAEHHEDTDEYKKNLTDLLATLETKIKTHEDALAEAATAAQEYEKVLQYHGQNLTSRHELMMDHVETRTGFEKEPVYQRLETKFDLALRDPELSGLGDRQMRQLFFSILGQNTKGFKDTVNEGFLVGQGFGNNSNENRTNFPFLYNAWLKRHGIDQAEIDKAATAVAAAKGNVNALPGVEDLIQHETSSPRLIDDSRLKAVALASGTMEDQLKYHEERSKAINDLSHWYKRLAGRADDASENPQDNARKVADYQQRAEKLELYITLEEAQVKFYRFKVEEEQAKETFTRERLGQETEEPWLLEVAMHQFVRAANMIDYPDGKQSASQADIYHPAVRRMMIAMIYNEGTAKWSIPSGTDRGTPDGKYDDNVVDEYSGMLSELAKSNDFNINLRGKFFLNEQARTYLLLSRYSNLIRLRIPGLEKEVETITGVFDATKKTNVNDKLGVNLDDPALTFDAAKKNLEAKLVELVAAELSKTMADSLQAARAKVEPVATTLRGLTPPIEPDDLNNPADLEAQRPITEEVLFNASNNAPAADVTAVAADRTKRIQLGIDWAKANPNTPAAAAAAMLEYIKEYKEIQEESRPDTKKEKLAYARTIATSNPTSNGNIVLAIQTLDYITKREVLRLYEEDTSDIDKFIQDPKHIAIRGTTELDRAAFLEHLRKRPSPEGPTENAKILDDWTAYAQQVELNYDLFDTQENSKMDYLDRMGISIKGCYQAYLNYIKANPEMRVDQWLNYLRSDDDKEFGKLVDLFRTIIPESEGGGKLDFLITFENWHKTRGREKTPENTKQETLALGIYSALAAHIQHEEAIAAASDRGEMEVVAKMEGMNIGEKISKYGEGVLNLLIGPGQSWTNRAAGMVIAYGAWKAARMAMKGEGKTGKGLRVLFMLGAAEIATKEITGRGLIDRASLFDTMGEAIEGTYEAVLVQRGIEGINEEQHTAALYELNTVPFHVAMNWYENTNPNGDPLPGQESNIKNSWSQMKVDIDRVCPSRVDWAEKDKEREAKIILKKTMEQFFGYVAEKDKSPNANFAKEALKERWIKDTEDSNFTETQARFTHELPTELTDQFHGNQNALTWQLVMRAEIDTADVEATNRQNWKDRAVDYASGKLAELERWGRQDVLGWAMPAAKHFWEELGTKAGQVKTWLGEMGEAGATKLHFGKEYVEYWYEGNKHTIRQFIDGHIEFTVDALKLPFVFIYEADQKILPWLTTKMRQIHEILRDDKLTSTKGQGPLQLQDIMTLPISTAGRDLRDVSKNPEYRYFGEYQKPFAKAFGKPGKFEIGEDPKDAFHYRIGYYISSVTKEDVGYVKGTDPALMMLKMQKASLEKARTEFIRQGAPQEQVGKMYAIHVIVQNGMPGAEEVPERMYMFLRMPMPGSMEYMLKTAPGNRWTDYMDPNKHKDRPPVLFDPKLGLVDNLEQALGLKLEGTRDVAGVAGLVFSQALKFPMWTGETAGEVVAFVPGLFSKDTAKWIQEVSSAKEDKKEWLDEKLTSAYSTDYAISKFYQDPVNAWWYRAALDYARDTQRDVWLGNPDLQWKGSRQKNILMDQPSDFNPNDFKVWLKNTQAKNHPPPKGVTLPK